MDSESPEVFATRVPLVAHGGPDYGELRRLGWGLDDVLDFSANSNPFGAPPGVDTACRAVELGSYPDRECLRLRDAIASHHGCKPAQVVPGNGSAELIALLAWAFLRPGDRALVVGPTFGEYERACALSGAQVETFTASSATGFAPDVDELIARVASIRPALTFLCNPNNPTGHYLTMEEVSRVLDAHRSGILVLDEAYVPFAENAWSSTPLLATRRLAVLRSLTKDCALAGLRLGYLLADPSIASAVRGVQAPWSVNTYAQAAGPAALAQASFVRSTLARTRRAAQELRAALTAIGLDVRPSSTHFFLVRTGDGAATRAGLLERRILVRDCASFGLPEYVRVATRRPADNDRLVEAWKEMAAPSIAVAGRTSTGVESESMRERQPMQ